MIFSVTVSDSMSSVFITRNRPPLMHSKC